MKQKRKQIVFVTMCLLVVIVVLVAWLTYDNQRRKEKTYLNIELVYTVNTEGLNKEQLDKLSELFDVATYYTTKKRLKKCGITIPNLKLKEDEKLFYSCKSEVKNVYYNSYKPTREWDSYYNPGPIILDLEYGKEKNNCIYIYKIKLPEGESFDLFKVY